MFDEDNIDLEEQMYLQDIQEELDAENEENEESEQEEDTYVYDLTKPFLDSQSTLPDKDKTEITVLHKKTKKIFRGFVVGKAMNDKNKYVFKMSEVLDNGEVGEAKTKIFSFSDIKKYL